MLNFLSLFIGVLAGLFAAIAFLPFLGWVNWAIIPLALVGLLLGAMSRSTSGRTLNLIVIVIGSLRLFLGGGFL
ncbi:hypothetical protein CLG96_01300 [Sphingomonas oleivorans]|uniref:Uncharacterized protein n=1 Tax=Sphingomonas oleivorans TaxID=1735121 RepID=A0A2T5G105_9SPHN|nr:hypothetical protein [Sphingomonas oleivorans]PTQ12812.1 hypothetical protein CLG96_01300 [Sphingomonas oleivorans]